MSDIRQWLEELGLGKYADAFQENDIGVDVLDDVTDQDLREIGVSLGDRKRLLTALRTPKQATEDPTAAEDLSVQPAPLAPEAERRQLTVMFCDLVGSTAMSAKLDPEELRAIMAAYQKAAGAVVARYDGHVAQYLGDGVLVYFGWPKAHEDDAERAVRAGLEIVEAVKSLEAPTELSVRVGIATGPVVVGEIWGGDPSLAKVAIGETPNLAARIQGLAAANTVAIGPRTRRLVGGAFELELLGTQELKGVAEPVEVCRVLGEAATESRFEAQSVGGLTPFVGRETEVAMLLDRWQQAKDGEGQVVLLSGEPGIGKSRITQVLRERVADEPHIRLRYQCSPFYSNSAFYPVIAQFEWAAGFARDDTADQKLDKMETALAAGTDDVAAVAPLFGAMLSLPIDRYPPLNVSPQKQKDNTIAALADQVAGLATRQPVLMLFEDAHWCDPTSLETLGAVIDRLRDRPVLLVITYRPEFEPPWTGHAHVTAHSLNRLSRRHGADMVARVTGGKTLPDEVLDQIVAKTDGVPLFVEELTKTVLEAGFLKDAGDHYELDGPLPQLTIPATLQDSLMARLDHLSPVKEVAQIGACIGREFSYELLAAVSRLRDNELQEALSQLVNANIIHRRGEPPSSVYIFKHALIQDTAHQTLLKSKRRQLHARIAVYLEKQFKDIVTVHPELLAQHHLQASNFSEACIYYLQAARLAFGRSLTKEAIAHATSGLVASEHMPKAETTDTLRSDLYLTIGRANIFAKGWGSPDALEAFTQSKHLSERIGDDKRLIESLYGLATFHLVGADIRTSLIECENIRNLGNTTDNTEWMMLGNSMSVVSSYYRGDFFTSSYYYDEFLKYYDEKKHFSIVPKYGPDRRMQTMGNFALSSYCLGYPDRAHKMSDEVVSLVNDKTDPLSSAIAFNTAAHLGGLVKNSRMTLVNSERTLNICREYGISYFIGHATAHHALGLILSGKNELGLEILRKGMRMISESGSPLAMTHWNVFLGEVLGLLGEFSRGLRQIEKAFLQVDELGEGYFEAEAYRIRGELLLMQDERSIDRAETAFHQAIEVASRQEAKSFELRAATSLARLWQGQGKTQEAHELLFLVYDWFTEGFDTADLKEAKALLDELK